MEEHMKQVNLRCTLTATLLALATTAAGYGQENQLTTKIPFAFRAAGSDLPAGRYNVGKMAGNSRTLELQNMDTGKAVFIPSKASLTDDKDVRPRLIFTCGGEEGCSLAKIWAGTGDGLEFPTPALTANQRERRETVYLDRFKAK
jgi:hypothetical protein